MQALRDVDEAVLSIDTEGTPTSQPQIKTLEMLAKRYPNDELTFANGGDEHGVLRSADGSGALPRIGDLLWLIPGHCDPTVNLHNQMYAIRGGLENGQLERVIRVDARGCVQ